VPSAYVLNFLEDKDFMQRLAQNHDLVDWLGRFRPVKPPPPAKLLPEPVRLHD